MGTLARSMPQFGLLMIMVLLPLNMLSGGMTSRESMPQFVQDIMQTMPTTHFVSLAQAILYRGADFLIVWPQFIYLIIIGGVFLVRLCCASAKPSVRWHRGGVLLPTLSAGKVQPPPERIKPSSFKPGGGITGKAESR